MTTGKVIRADKGNSNTSSVIAVYSETDQKTVLYLHAREVYVELNEDVKPGYLLGRQGNTGLGQSNDTDRSHVHIEVRTLTKKQMDLSLEKQMEELVKPAHGKNDKERPTIDPVPYLYTLVNAAEQELNGRGGNERQSSPDVNNDDRVDIFDLILVWLNVGQDANDFQQFDVNHDGVIDKEDIIAVANNLDDPEIDAPSAISSHNQIGGITIRARQVYIDDRMVSRETVQQLLNLVGEADDGSLAFKHSVTMIEKILEMMTPNKTALLANYPNPFNPETWIPYQLAKPADVTLSIYSVDGKLIRRLALGHQAAGIYQNRSRAAYWDGRNTQGEPVASGVYFYTFKAGSFTATRKMSIRK